MKVYIAGKITGCPNYKERFYDAEKALNWEGHIALSPADLPEGMTTADYMRICFAMIDVADCVAFLPGWEDSPGARLEHAYCVYIDKKTLWLKDYAPYQNQTLASCNQDGISF